MNAETHIDAKGIPLVVGSRVRIVGGTSPQDDGTVTRISDPDGDADDEGRTIGINPRVFVAFNDCEDSFTTDYTGDGYADAPWQCEELEVIP